jgi:hypothetical protein
MDIENIIKPVVATVVIGGLTVGLNFGIIKPAKESARINREFIQAYHHALFQYADKNKDGLISASEQDKFNVKLISDKRVILTKTLFSGDILKYRDGTTVPIQVVTEWIKNYKPSE